MGYNLEGGEVQGLSPGALQVLEVEKNMGRKQMETRGREQCPGSQVTRVVASSNEMIMEL